MRLNVRVVCPEEFLGSVDRERFDFIDFFTATVIAAARVALSILVSQNRPDGFENRLGHKIFRRDQFDRKSLAATLSPQEAGDVRIGPIEMRGH